MWASGNSLDTSMLSVAGSTFQRWSLPQLHIGKVGGVILCALKVRSISWACWYCLVIPALRRLKEEGPNKFKAILGYIVSLRPT